MKSNSVDREIVEMTAENWIVAGGDAEGFIWMMNKIHERIKEMEDFKKAEKEEQEKDNEKKD